jgi:hypothetical protein
MSKSFPTASEGDANSLRGRFRPQGRVQRVPTAGHLQPRVSRLKCRSIKFSEVAEIPKKPNGNCVPHAAHRPPRAECSKRDGCGCSTASRRLLPGSSSCTAAGTWRHVSSDQNRNAVRPGTSPAGTALYIRGKTSPRTALCHWHRNSPKRSRSDPVLIDATTRRFREVVAMATGQCELPMAGTSFCVERMSEHRIASRRTRVEYCGRRTNVQND